MKVLIISHNPISTKNNMGKTLLSLFSEFKKEELCQLYIYPTIPDTEKCSSYFRITDKEALAAIVSGKVPGNEIDKNLINENQGLYEHEEDEAFYRNKKNKSAVRRILRDTVWKFSGANSKKLEKWLMKEKPDCIFTVPGTATFIHDLTIKISEKLQIPIVTYICDEYYFVEEPKAFISKIQFFLLKNKIEKLMKKSSGLAVICDELKNAYEKRFKVPAKVFMTGTAFPVAEKANIREKIKNISYFGNIRCNRFVSLCEIGKALDEISSETKESIGLKIYTGEKDEEILEMFREINSVEIKGFLSGKEFEKAFFDADMLLHTEAFDTESINRVRHSVSTKIADSLGSGIPLFAYGPKEVSSIKHLEKNNCAVVAVSQSELKKKLEYALSDKEMLKKTTNNAIETAKKYHINEKTGKELKRFIEDLI